VGLLHREDGGATEVNIGDPVELTAPEALTSDGSVLLPGTRGYVVGFQGFAEVIVAWGSNAPYQFGTVSRDGLRKREPQVSRSVR
jgi:hypothetical protein